MKMKYALVNNERQEPEPGLKGKCQCCDGPVVSKCGNVKVWHWAHKTKLECDLWWEETDWHRAWKEQFPKEWQEVIHKAENGEKHIADVKCNQGYVIEFQHSPIKSEERQAREFFYKKMIWIVDGMRRLKDKDKFYQYSEPVNGNNNLRILLDCFNKCNLLRDWIDSNTTVLFDFGDNLLWVLLPRSLIKTAEERYVFIVDRNLIIALLHEAHNKISLEIYINELALTIEEGEKSLRLEKRKKRLNH